eukprot:m.413048 g.413048  ORF g.413048 m.413048 type:complete len:158 (+) comp21262_c0_seq4:255-728(+)
MDNMDSCGCLYDGVTLLCCMRFCGIGRGRQPIGTDGEDGADDAPDDDSSTAVWLAHVTTDTLMSKPFADTFRLHSGRDSSAGSKCPDEDADVPAAAKNHRSGWNNLRRAHSADWSKDLHNGSHRHNGGGHKFLTALETIKVAQSESDFGSKRDGIAG